MNYKKTRRYVIGLCTALVLLPSVVQATVGDTQVTLSAEEQDKQLFAEALKLSTEQKWSMAEPIYRDLLKRNTEWPEPKNNLAILLLKTDRLEEAKQMLEQAVISSPSYRIAQKNRTQLYNFLATQAYGKALGQQQPVTFPEMDYIEQIYQPVITVEKIVEKVVEKIVEKKVEVIVEKQVPVEVASISQIADESVADLLQQQVLIWSEAWSKGDYENYIQIYSEQFEPLDERKSFSEWKNIRKAKLKFGTGIKVTLDNVKVFVDDSSDRALVEFTQRYKSASYSDIVLKQLYMQKEQNNWRILSERVIKTF